MLLPPTESAFHWTRETWGDALRCRPLDVSAQHLFTTRQLQLRSPDLRVDGWQHVAASLGATIDQMLRVRQVHGRTVRVVAGEHLTTAMVSEKPDADAVISNVAGAVLVVQVADCVPMLIAAPGVGAAAAVHAGWRGTCAGIGRATIEAFAREFGADPSQLVVAMGPSIGACCYEVGPELVGAFRGAGASDAELARWFSRTDTGSLRLDLWAANRDQLVTAGVSPSHIHLSRLCTRTYADIFDSYRADGARAGRLAAAIRVPHI